MTKLPTDVWRANNRKAQLLLDCLKRAPRGPVAEIGSVRCPEEVDTDGFSTIYLARACEADDRTFHSFDVDHAAVDNANTLLRAHDLREVASIGDGLCAMWAMPPMAMLYLDSHALARYTTDQFCAAKILPGGIVVIDDAHEFNGQKHGKATGVVPICEALGFDVEFVPTEFGYTAAVICFLTGKQPV